MAADRHRIAPLGVALIGLAAGCVYFSEQSAGLAGTQPGDRALMVDIGDVDGDGLRQPLVLTDREIVTMSVCGSGCLQRDSAIALDAADDVNDPLHSTTFAVGDYNGDQIDDVAVGTALSVRVYFGGVQSPTRPTAGLRADDVSDAIAGRPYIEQFTGPLPGNPWQVLGPADIDDDGTEDLVLSVAEEYASATSTGPTTFGTATTIIQHLSPRASFPSDALADVDGDGRNELLVQEYGLAGTLVASVVTFGAPGFASITHLDTADTFCGIDAVGDVDGDGLDDVLLGNAVHLSTGSSFDSASTDTAEEGRGLISDLDRDGDGDLLATDTANRSLVWRNGGGAGTFHDVNGVERLQRPVDGSPGQFVTGDVTGDEFDDLVFVDVGAPSARVVMLLNAVTAQGSTVYPHERPRRSLANGSPFGCS